MSSSFPYWLSVVSLIPLAIFLHSQIFSAQSLSSVLFSPKATCPSLSFLGLFVARSCKWINVLQTFMPDINDRLCPL